MVIRDQPPGLHSDDEESDTNTCCPPTGIRQNAKREITSNILVKLFICPEIK